MKKKKKNKKRQMFSWMNPKLEVRETGKFGKGVFAKERIRKGSMLIVMGGYILTIEDDNNLKGIVVDKPIEISDYFFFGARKASDLELMPQHYVNHSCDPNAGFKGQVFMVAMRNIKKDEEICYDYAMVMNSDERSNSYFTIDCKCGSKRCRGIITEDDWVNPVLQKKYDGFFQYFLQEKIIEALAYEQKEVFAAAVKFAKNQGIIPAPESAHAIKAVFDEAEKCRQSGEAKIILFNLSGHGHLDLGAYEKFLEGEME